MIGKVKKFISEVVVELKKVSWSTKQEVIDSTWLVIVSSAFLGFYIGITDFALSKLIGLLIR